MHLRSSAVAVFLKSTDILSFSRSKDTKRLMECFLNLIIQNKVLIFQVTDGNYA